MIQDFIKGLWYGALMLFHFGIIFGSLTLPILIVSFLFGDSLLAFAVGACMGLIFCSGVIHVYWEKYPI